MFHEEFHEEFHNVNVLYVMFYEEPLVSKKEDYMWEEKKYKKSNKHFGYV